MSSSGAIHAHTSGAIDVAFLTAWRWSTIRRGVSIPLVARNMQFYTTRFADCPLWRSTQT